MAKKMDADVKAMSLVELRREVMRLRCAFRKEASHTGNHRCWINLLAGLPEEKHINPLTLSECEFLSNCKRYFERNQQLRTKRKKRR